MEIPKLGQMLLDAKLVTDEQITMALKYQENLRVSLPEIFVRFGMLKDEVLMEFVAKEQGLPVADLKGMVIPENLVKRIPQKLIEGYKVIPIAFQDGVLTLATSDPTNMEMVEAIQLATNLKIELAVASAAEIKEAIKQLFYSEGAARTKEELLKELERAPDSGKVGAEGEISPAALWDALIPLLIEKGIITREELAAKARTLG
ncbi:MAG: hypothetical protein HYY93_02910 [Planctomycetes bacterium]|nr:hypothetical protein [Planctomycetota bacterium]